jgi:hypothetical protein
MQEADIPELCAHEFESMLASSEPVEGLDADLDQI